MSKSPAFVLDADCFIRAKREHYAPDFCPAYWDALIRGFEKKALHSISPIRKELLRGKDALATWVQDKAPEQFFFPVDGDSVQSAYASVIEWCEEEPQYSRAAKQKFVGGADPWLVAFAFATRNVIVTYEVAQPNSKSLIKLPDVAKHFDVECRPPYAMLRELKVRFTLEK